MSLPECVRDNPHQVPNPKTCIEHMADGWINPPDLCSTCTQAFMAALNWVAEPVTLKWHSSYVDRAAEQAPPVAVDIGPPPHIAESVARLAVAGQFVSARKLLADNSRMTPEEVDAEVARLSREGAAT